MEQADINDELKKAFLQDNKQMPDNFDTQAFGHYVLNTPGLSQAYRLGKSATTVCTNANQYVFWDDLHPTEAVHQIFAQMVVEKLTEAGEG